MLFKNRPHIFPATLAQRFSGAIMDIGIILILIAGLVVISRWLGDVPLEPRRPRYIPPHPDMGWSRVLRSLYFWSGVLLGSAILIASPLRTTPGMAMFHMQIHRMNGNRVYLPRALAWAFTAFLPVLSANFLILAGIALQKPLIHLGTLNVFSLLIILQSIWFLPMLMRKDKRAVHDIIWNVKVDFHSDREDRLHPFKKVFFTMILMIALSIAGAAGGLFSINLFDAPLNPRIAELQKQGPENPYEAIRVTWKNQNSFEIDLKLNDFRCASRSVKVTKILRCQPPDKIREIITSYRPVIQSYRQDIVAGDIEHSVLHEKYLNQESVALTDLVLADLILRHENDKETDILQEWKKMELFWRGAIQKPGHLISQSKAVIHYNHVLLALPVLLKTDPGLMNDHWQDIENALAPIPYGAEFMQTIMAYEYSLYDRMLQRSQIEYFPLIHPNHLRNQFMIVVSIFERLFKTEQTLSSQHEILVPLRNQYKLNTLYNPIGIKLRDLALANVTSNLHVVTAYHHNNALKKMIKIRLEAMRLGISADRMVFFLKSLPDEEKTVFQTQPIQWDDSEQVLYFTMPQLEGLRRELPF